MKPEISIITATYNRAYILRKAINSVRNQTFKNWEHIIVDDGSDDTTADIMADFMKADERIKYIKQDKNRGQSRSINQNINIAKAPLVAFLDSDDEFHQDFLKKQISYFSSNPEIGLCYVGADYHNGQNYLGTVHPKVSGNLELFLFKNLKGLGASLSGFAVKKSVFEKVGYFDEIMPSQKDLDFFVRVAKHFPIGYIEGCNTIIHIDSSNRVMDNAKSILSGEIMFLEKHESRIRELGLYHHVARKLARKYVLYQKNLPMAYKYLLKSIKAKPSYLYSYLYTLKLPTLYFRSKI